MSKKFKYRSFRNGDIAGITHVWNAVESPDYLPLKPNFGIIAKSLLFDPNDLFVAIEIDDSLPTNPACEGRIIGFIHGGFGPGPDNMTPDHSVGTIAMLRVEFREDREEIGQTLLNLMEQRFVSLGAKKIYAGAVYPHAPFYISLLSTGELHGIIDSSTFSIDLLKKNRYAVDSTYELYRIDISDGIPEVSAELSQASYRYPIYHHYKMEKRVDTWWREVAFQDISRSISVIMEYEDDAPAGSAASHSFDPNVRSEKEIEVAIRNVSSTCSIFATIHDLYIQPEFRRKKMGQVLVYSILQDLHRNGHKFVELQVPKNNLPALALFDRLKFSNFADSFVFYKNMN